MLSITDISVRIAGRLLIDDSTVQIVPGARVGFVGRNGVGKSTLFHAIRGDLPGFPERRCLDDLAAYLAEGGRFKLAASAEFVESPAALPAFEKTYGFHLKSAQLLTLSGGNTAATLRAAAEGISGVNAAMAYGTDGEIAVASVSGTIQVLCA